MPTVSFLSSSLTPLHSRLHSPPTALQPQTSRLHTKTPPTISPKLLHAVYRVADVASTRRFLTALGMHVLRERDVPAENYTNVFFGYGPEQKGVHFSLEPTYNYGVGSYENGNGFGYFGVAVQDISQVVERVRAEEFKVLREVGPIKRSATVIAFVEDPTGYRFSLIQHSQRDPLSQAMLRVKDLDASIAFFGAVGMRLFRKLGNPDYRYTLAFVGFAKEHDSTVLELTYNWGDHDYTPGTGYSQIAVSVRGVFDAEKGLEENGIELGRKAGPVTGIGTKICAVRDPDGWKTALVDEKVFEEEFEE